MSLAETKAEAGTPASANNKLEQESVSVSAADKTVEEDQSTETSQVAKAAVDSSTSKKMSRLNKIVTILEFIKEVILTWMKF